MRYHATFTRRADAHADMPVERIEIDLRADSEDEAEMLADVLCLPGMDVDSIWLMS